MSLVTTFRVGELTCHALEGGRQALDGGAMFGVVPKPLWSRRIAPDARNRIPLAMRCLLLEHPAGLVLIDTAIGNKDDEKFRDIYGITGAGTGVGGRPTQLERAIAQSGYSFTDVRWVINTHLHFDHAGGNTLLEPGAPDLGAAPAFPNASYVVQRGELAYARQTNERTRASYLPDNFEPVDRADRWTLLDGDGEILPGLEARVTPGHVPWHQSLILRSGGETMVFLGDLVPTSHHLPLAWIMGYDVEPLRTLESKRALLAEAVREGWWLCFEHDPVVVVGRAVAGPKAVELEAVKALDDVDTGVGPE